MTEERTKKPAKKRVPKPKSKLPVKKTSARKRALAPAVVSAVETPRQKPVKTVHRTYTFAVGRRKSAIARVRFIPKGTNRFTINGREVDNYFPTFELRKIARDAIELTKYGDGADLSVRVHGGGIHGQAEAVRLGISRAFVKLSPDLRTTLKRAGFLTRDPRVKERKKYGLKRARRAPQWQKR